MSYIFSDPIRTYADGATAHHYRKGKKGQKIHTCIRKHDPTYLHGVWVGHTYCASGSHFVWLNPAGCTTVVQGRYFPDHASAEKFLLAAYEGLLP